MGAGLPRESPCCPKKGYVMATNVCKQGTREEHWTSAHHLVANEPPGYQRDTLLNVQVRQRSRFAVGRVISATSGHQLQVLNEPET